MIGILVTGHGEFSKGLMNAAEMIGGKTNNSGFMMFEDGMNLEQFGHSIREKINDLLIECPQGVLVLTDLLGGTPFNVSVMQSTDMKAVRVIAGTNLPMLIEGMMLSRFSDSVEELANQLVQVGHSGLLKPDFSEKIEGTDVEEDGI